MWCYPYSKIVIPHYKNCRNIINWNTPIDKVLKCELLNRFYRAHVTTIYHDVLIKYLQLGKIEKPHKSFCMQSKVLFWKYTSTRQSLIKEGMKARRYGIGSKSNSILIKHGRNLCCEQGFQLGAVTRERWIFFKTRRLYSKLLAYLSNWMLQQRAWDSFHNHWLNFVIPGV